MTTGLQILSELAVGEALGSDGKIWKKIEVSQSPQWFDEGLLR